MKTFLLGFILASILWPVGYIFRSKIKFWLVNHGVIKG